MSINIGDKVKHGEIRGTVANIERRPGEWSDLDTGEHLAHQSIRFQVQPNDGGAPVWTPWFPDRPSPTVDVSATPKRVHLEGIYLPKRSEPDATRAIGMTITSGQPAVSDVAQAIGKKITGVHAPLKVIAGLMEEAGREAASEAQRNITEIITTPDRHFASEGLEIRMGRQHLGRTLKSVAEATGLTVEQVSRAERGFGPWEYIDRIADELGVTLPKVDCGPTPGTFGVDSFQERFSEVHRLREALIAERTERLLELDELAENEERLAALGAPLEPEGRFHHIPGDTAEERRRNAEAIARAMLMVPADRPSASKPQAVASQNTPSADHLDDTLEWISFAHEAWAKGLDKRDAAEVLKSVAEAADRTLARFDQHARPVPSTDLRSLAIEVVRFHTGAVNVTAGTKRGHDEAVRLGWIEMGGRHGWYVTRKGHEALAAIPTHTATATPSNESRADDGN